MIIANQQIQLHEQKTKNSIEIYQREYSLTHLLSLSSIDEKTSTRFLIELALFPNAFFNVTYTVHSKVTENILLNLIHTNNIL